MCLNVLDPPSEGYDATQPDVSDGVLVTTEQDNGHIEWGKWHERYGYEVLGWTWTGEDGTTGYAVPEGGPLSLEEFQQVVQAHGG